MKWTLAATLLLAGLQGLPSLVGPLIPDSTSSVTGVVRRADTGQPIPEAQVVVASAGEPLDQAMTRATLTDLKGKFTIKNVNAGLYSVVVQCEGYFPPGSEASVSQRATKDIVLSEGQQVDSGALELIPGAAVSGRVAGPDGQPLTAARVQALRAFYIRGRLAFTPVKTAITNDLGEYRLFWLPPGEYYVRSQFRETTIPRPEKYARVFFPGIPEEDAAPPVLVSAGAELSGIDLRIPVAPVAGVTVSGQVTAAGDNAAELRVSSVYVVPRDRRVLLVGDDADAYPNLAADVSRGQFEIRNVPSGAYNLLPVIRGRPAVPLPAPVDVADRNIENVSAVLDLSVELRGRVTLDDGSPGNRVSRNSVVLVADDKLQANAAAVPINPDPETGEFLISQIPPGKYALQVASAFRSPDVYVADVKTGESSVFDNGFTLSGSVSSLEVVLKSRGGIVSGVAFDSARLRPAPYVEVVLIPEPGRRQNFELYKHAMASSDGTVTFRGVAPGNYKLFAWPSVTPGAWENASFLERFEDRGVGVSVAAGSEASVKIPVIP